MAEPKKLSPMMQKKLAEQQSKPAPPTEAKVESPATKPEPAVAKPVAAPKPTVVAVAKPVQKSESAPTPKMSSGSFEKNPNGERYGYGDGLASTFGTPPAIDDAFDAVRIVSKIPATILDGAITFFKKVTS